MPTRASEKHPTPTSEEAVMAGGGNRAMAKRLKQHVRYIPACTALRDANCSESEASAMPATSHTDEMTRFKYWKEGGGDDGDDVDDDAEDGSGDATGVMVTGW